VYFLRILVTGGAGYIGSHTAKELAEAGHQVVILDNLSKGHRAAIGRIKFIQADLADKKLIGELLRKEKIEAVMHFAASSLVGESMQQPAAYYQNNVINGLNLLGAMLEAGVFRLVFSSTAAVYGEPVGIPIQEDHPALPTNTYGATKLSIEQALFWYGQAYGLKYISLRYFNAAGADPDEKLGEDHDPETHLIPLVLKVALGQLPKIKIFGNDYPTADGTCVRDYIHVTDLASAHVLALEALADGKGPAVYNLGNGNGYSVLEVIQETEKVTGRLLPKAFTGRRPGDPAVLVASSEKIKNELNWKPRYSSLGTIIETAWRWHRANPRGYRKGISL